MIYEWTLENIIDKIKQNCNIRVLEKNKFGEVNTPFVFINELLENFP